MSGSIFDQYAGPADEPEPEPAATPPTPKHEEYHAAKKFLADEDRYHMLAVLSNGDMRLVSTAFAEVVSFYPEQLAFVYSSGSLFMLGRNLRALIPLLQKREIKELHAFDPARHVPPAVSAPIIELLEWAYPEAVRNPDYLGENPPEPASEQDAP